MKKENYLFQKFIFLAMLGSIIYMAMKIGALTFQYTETRKLLEYCISNI